MQLENYLPSSEWGKDYKELIKEHKTVAILVGSALLFSFPMGAIAYSYIVWKYLAKYIIDEQIKKRSKAIMDAFPGEFNNEEELKQLYENDRKKFNNLFKISSDEYCRMFFTEQVEHKKAQEIIIELQNRINKMEKRVEFFKEKENKNRNEIEELRAEIDQYENILRGWKERMQSNG